MNKKFLPFIIDPENKEELHTFSIEEEGTNIEAAILYNQSCTSFYPIIDGVPTMFKNFLPIIFYSAYKDLIDSFFKKYPSLKTEPIENDIEWSFSNEWEHFSESQMQTTWGISIEERFRRFLYENEINETCLKDKIILDAGCGNGTHTENISTKGTLTIGIDYSTSVYYAEKRRKSDNVLFVRGDLQSPPFPNNFFDILFSNGVIHHTPNTYKTFLSLIPLIKGEGSLYLWLYNRQGGFFWSLKRRFFDINRFIICRTPKFIQTLMVNLYTSIIWNLYKLIRVPIGQDYNTLKLNIWDSITPRWRHYHEPFEVWNWYINNGFNPPKITNWETLYGYGVLGFKKHNYE